MDQFKNKQNHTCLGTRTAPCHVYIYFPTTKSDHSKTMNKHVNIFMLDFVVCVCVCVCVLVDVDIYTLFTKSYCVKVLIIIMID